VYSAQIPISDITKNMVMTVQVTGMGRWKVRFKVAIFFIRIASWIMGTGIKVEKTDE
jgi:1-acyl-sn-glycerol-3-phosphate acyltransferase